jgi:hypothetical protein
MAKVKQLPIEKLIKTRRQGANKKMKEINQGLNRWEEPGDL